MNSKKRKKVGLALGSGGARGISHIGVIKILVENNIPIDYIAGSSIGAMVGGAYAAKKDIPSIEEIVKKSDWRLIRSLIDPSIKNAILEGKKVEGFIKKYAGNITFNNLKIPLAVVTTDLKTGLPIIIDQGKVVKAIRASIAVPAVFKPIEYKKYLLSDGGLSIPVPVKIVREMGADIVIAVNLDKNIVSPIVKKLTMAKTAIRSVNILRYNLADQETDKADIAICPKTGNVSWGKFIGGEKLIKIGEKTCEEKISQIKNNLDNR